MHLKIKCAIIICVAENCTQGYSSAGRVPVSKTVGRGFESSCPCQKRTPSRLAWCSFFGRGRRYREIVCERSEPWKERLKAFFCNARFRALLGSESSCGMHLRWLLYWQGQAVSSRRCASKASRGKNAVKAFFCNARFRALPGSESSCPCQQKSLIYLPDKLGFFE